MIAELKANLSSYLAQVRKGKTIVVCDRATPIARLVPLKSTSEEELLVDEAEDPPAAARKYKGLKLLLKSEVDHLLGEDRSDRELLR